MAESMRYNSVGSFKIKQDKKGIQFPDLTKRSSWKKFEKGYGLSKLKTNIWNYYTFEQALEVCPDGWHLPTEKEWYQLINFSVRFALSKNIDNAGSLLLSMLPSSFYNNNNNIEIVDLNLGFNAVPITLKYDGAYSLNVYEAVFPFNSNNIYNLFYVSENYFGSRHADIKEKFQVRCIKD